MNYSKLLYWFLGVIAALLVSVMLLVNFLDWNQYRAPLAELASRQMDMRVELAGNVSIALYPRPSVSAEAVRLSPATEGFSDVVATAERIEVRFGIGNFLKGQLSPHSLRLYGVDVTVEETEQGRWQVRGWPEDAGTSNPEIGLMRLRLEGSRATLLPRGGSPFEVEGLALRLDGNLPGGPLTWEGEFSVGGEKVESTGRVRPVMVRDELSVKADFALANSNISVSGRVLPEGNLTGRANLEGEALGTFLAALNTVTQTDAIVAPDLPFKFDVQIDKTGDVTRIVSREFMISDTRSRLDLTLAQTGEKTHLTGIAAMGVIDFDHWLAETKWRPGQSESEPEVPTPTEGSPFTGTVDVNIEGFQVRNGLGQRIDAVVVFDEAGVGFNRISGLLPGATSATFTGRIGAEAGHGKFMVEAGNISELAAWLGLAFPDFVPHGRLATAKLEADLDFKDDAWILSNIDGQVDSTALKGELGGGFSRAAPWHIKASAERLNLDAYIPRSVLNGSSDSETSGFPADVDLSFDIALDEMQALDQGFAAVRSVGSLKGGKLEFSHLAANHGSGSVQMKGSVSEESGQKVLDVSAEMQQWGLPVVGHFVPALSPALHSLNMSQLDGTASIVGAVDSLTVGIDTKNGSNEFAVSGTAGLDGSNIAALNLQGNFTHNDLSGLLRQQGLANLKSMPVRATLAVTRSGAESPIILRVGGDAVGGNLTSELTLQDGLKGLHLTYNHNRVADFVSMSGLDLPGFDYSSSLRSEFRFGGSGFPEAWNVKIENLRNGDLAVSGDIQVTNNNQLDGNLSISGLAMTSGAFGKMGGQSTPSTTLSTLAEFAGNVSVRLEDVHLAGQRFDADSASVTIGDGVARLTLGDNARLNDEAITMTANIDLIDQQPFNGKIDAAKLDIGALLDAEGRSPFLTAQTSLQADFSGNATNIKTLRANGSLNGQAGALHFLSVSGLVNEIQNAQTGRSFLGEVGGLLRNGTTAISTIDGRFTIDQGIMLLETARATGDWGNLALHGQLNFVDEFLTMKGELALSTPPDVPAIPVDYEGSFNNPSARWSSRLFERFVIALIERRVRTALFKELEERTATSSEAGSNPGVAVFTRAFGILSQLKKAQEEKRRAEAAAQTEDPKGDSQ